MILRSASVLIVVTLIACSPPYEGAQCRSIGTGAPASTLPLGPVGPLTETDLGQPGSYFNFTNEIACCIKNPMYRGTGCSAVSCSEVIAKTTGAHVMFTNDPCGRNLGNSYCAVFIQDAKVVGVYAQCRD